MKIFYCNSTVKRHIAVFIAVLLLYMSSIPRTLYLHTEALGTQIKYSVIDGEEYISRYAGSRTRLSSVKTDSEIARKISRLALEYGKAGFEENRLIVKLKNSSLDLTDLGAVEAVAAPDNIFILQFADAELASNALAKLKKEPAVEYAEPDSEVSVESENESSQAMTPSTPAEASSSAANTYISWGAQYIGADEYSAYLKTLNITKQVKIAVVDSGMDFSHEVFNGRTLTLGHDYVDNDEIPQDEMGHGSHTAGIIADLTKGFSNISLYPLKVFNRYGTGSSAAIGYAIRSAANNGADIINLSLSCTSTEFVNESVTMAVDKGSLIVFAAGNNAYQCDRCPVDISDKEGILVVSSINANGVISDFSNFSDIVDICAPGENINSVNYGGGYTLKSGTSMAAPHVSAAAALLKCEYPTADPAILERMIKAFSADSGTKGFDSFYGYGVCDLSLAISSKMHIAKINGDEITYMVKNREATLQKVKTLKQSFTVEQTIGGCPVTGIAESTFFDCIAIKSITLPDCMEHIDPMSFARCTSLERIDAQGDAFCSRDGILYNGDFTKLICYPPAKSGTSFTIPENVLSLEYGAFSYCSSLITVTLNTQIESLGDMPFRGCNSLKRIYAGISCENFADISGVLYDKSRTKLIKYPSDCPITDITLPATVNEICDGALENGAGLKTLHAYNSLRRIGKNSFAGCTALTSVSIYNGLLYIDSMAFWKCGALKSISVPQTVTHMGRYAFAECSSIETAEINSNITSLGSGAFYKCTSVTSVTVSTPISDYGYRVFFGCTSLKTAVISDGVTTLGKYMFAGCSRLDGVIVPSSVKSIYAAAFSNCSSLKSIDINCGLTSMQSSVFANCHSLCTLDLPDTLKSIGSKAFSDCTSLSAVIVPDSVESISSFTFLRCTALRTLYLGTHVQEVPDYCFDGCEALEYLFIMGNTSYINLTAFDGCDSLTKITVSGYNSRYESPSGVLIDKSESKLLLYPPKKNTVSYTLPENVTKLNSGAFKNNHSLASLIIPNRVTEIGEGCFAGVNSLKSLTIGNILATNTLCTLFPDSVSLLETVRITADFSEIKEGMFEKCSSLAAVSVPNSVTRIGDRAFSGCLSLRIITLPSTVSYIGERAFYRCEKLTYVNIPDNLTEIKPYTFYGCRSLAEVNVPDTVTEIGERAFYGCSSLIEINIPADIIKIYPYTFYGCRSVTSLSVPYDVTEIGEYAFYGCTGVTQMNIPESVKKIGGYAFGSMSKLSVITLGGGLTELGSGAFEGCTSLTEITVPDTVTFIGFSCFARCTSLTGIILSNGISVITKNMLSGCSALKSVSLPNGITDINESAFSGCTQLESVTCGENIQNIGKLAFSGCIRLGAIRLGDNVSYISADAFSGCSKINLLCSVNSYVHRYAAQNGIYYTVIFSGDGWSAEMTPENDILTSFDLAKSFNMYGTYYRVSAYSGADKVTCGATLGITVPCATATNADMYVISSQNTDTGAKTALEYSIENGSYRFDLSEFDRISIEKGVKGDTNLDGKYDSDDVNCLLDILTSSVDSVSVQSRLADINGDGETNLLDAYLMLVQNNS